MMHEKARARIFRMIATCPPEHRDFYLDQYLDSRDLATEWDAGEWDLPYPNEPVPGFSTPVPPLGTLREPSKRDLGVDA